MWSVVCYTVVKIGKNSQVRQLRLQDTFREKKRENAKAHVRVAYGRKYRDFSNQNSCSEKFQGAGIVYLQRPQSSEHQQNDTYPL